MRKNPHPDCPVGKSLIHDSHVFRRELSATTSDSVNCDGYMPESHERRIEAVDHPPHYGGEDDPYEAVKVIEAWKLPWHLGDCVKYIARHGKKDPAKTIEDLKKARWYLDRYIKLLEGKK